jgi:hypothetical protein
MRQAYPRVIPPDQAGRGFSLAGSNFGGNLLGVPGERYVNNTAQTRLPHVRLFSQVGPVVLFVAALYYRFARHDALRFYVFFGAAAIVAFSTFFATVTTDLICSSLNSSRDPLFFGVGLDAACALTDSTRHLFPFHDI